MSEKLAYLELTTLSEVDAEIQNHAAWLGNVSGLKAEKMLRGLNIPYLYVLRAGEMSDDETQTHYYVTFIQKDGSVKHQPFVITITSEGWCWENLGCGGPCASCETFNTTALHKIMHCEEGECQPYLYGKS